MKNFVSILGCLAGLCACSSHDPILPGTRTAVFSTTQKNILNINIEQLPETSLKPSAEQDEKCTYTQDQENVIWDGEKRVFSGFPTGNSVKSVKKPVCNGNYIYAGLTTGELVKIDAKNRQIAWIADIYRNSNMTGGATIVDIIAPIVINGTNVYAGGLGDALCKINDKTGTKIWCTDISVGLPFIVTQNAIFVVSTDDNLYAIRPNDGAIYWTSSIKKQNTPEYHNKTIHVGNQIFDATTGKLMK